MTGKIPQEFIDDLLDRVDIVEVISSRTTLRKAGREYKACCPFHDEKTPSFTVSPDKQFYHCFGCGAHGTAVGFLMDFEHMGFVEAIEELAAMQGVDVPREGGAAPARSNDDLYALLGDVSQFYQQNLKGSATAIDYLKRRGLTGENAAAFAVGYAPDSWDTLCTRFGGDADGLRRLKATGMIIERDSGGFYDRFRGRIMFPIRDARGRVIAFGGRVLDKGEPKYLNSPETVLFRKSQALYGLYEARQALRDIPRLLVVEGYMDVVGLAQQGVQYAVATLGTATTPAHLRQLFRIASEVVFCFDGDRAGRAAAWRALENALPEMREGRDIRFLFLPEGEDPDSLVQAEGRDRFEARLQDALPLSQYLVRSLSAQVDLQSVEGRARLAEHARPLLATTPQGVYREMLIGLVAETVQMDRDRLAGMLVAPGKRQEAPVQPRPAPPASRSSLARRAIAMLLAEPRLALSWDPYPGLADAPQPGHRLLGELLEQCRANPGLRTAALLERWRERPEGRHFQKLLKARLEQLGERTIFSPEGLKQEFRDLMKRVEEELDPARERVLLDKLARDGLSPLEKEELRALHVARKEALTGNDRDPEKK